MKRDAVDLHYLCSGCSVAVLCLFLAVPCTGLLTVIGSFPGHSHLVFMIVNIPLDP